MSAAGIGTNCLSCGGDDFVWTADTVRCHTCGDNNPLYQKLREDWREQRLARLTPRERVLRERFSRRIQAAIDGRKLKLVP